MNAAAPEATSAIASRIGTSRTPLRIAASAAAMPGAPVRARWTTSIQRISPFALKPGTVSGRWVDSAAMPEQRTSDPRQEGARIEYGPHYFRRDCGVPYRRDEHWLEFFGRVADGIVRELGPTSVLDAGCAMGLLVEALRKREVEAWGIDISEYAISQVHESVRDHCRVASITEPLPRRYDLIVCIEVLEHLPPGETDAAIASLCANTDRLLLSTTPTDYGEATHLNVRPQEAWSALLAREGFLRDLEVDLSYVTPWAALYVRTEEPLVETVRRYDRSWWRLQTEVGELRRSLLARPGAARQDRGGRGRGPAQASARTRRPRRGAAAAARPADREGRRTGDGTGDPGRAGRALGPPHPAGEDRAGRDPAPPPEDSAPPPRTAVPPPPAELAGCRLRGSRS